MSRTLTLIHAGWGTIRALARSGRRRDALNHIGRLLACPDLPQAVAADAHRLAAELLIDAEDYTRARRHLRAAILIQPAHPHSHYLLGQAFEQDPNGDDRRAACWYKKAVNLEPTNPLYRAAFGRAAVRADRPICGTRNLLVAADASPDNVAVLRIVVDGLLEAGRTTDARRVLVKARFLRPADRTVSGLWERVRFETARLGQQAARSTQDAAIAMDGESSVIPFVRVVGAGSHQGPSSTIRWDSYSKPRPHVARFRSARSDG